MPVLLTTLQDPTDIVMQGEQLRVSVTPVSYAASSTTPMLPSITGITGFDSVVGDEDAFLPMNSFIEGNRLSMRRITNGVLQVRANAGISTTSGAWVWQDWSPLIGLFIQNSSRWSISGITKDSSGSALGGCRVVAMETGRIAVGGADSEVAETISDGSGNYSIEVALNTAHQLHAYKPGSPDVAGITRNDVTPTQLG